MPVIPTLPLSLTLQLPQAVPYQISWHDAWAKVSPLLSIVSLILPIISFPSRILLSPDALVANTTSGLFLGAPATVPGVTSFLGIPYAEPPVGDLRFRAPRPLVTIPTGVQTASAFKDACPQPAADDVPVPISEGDCLNLNVYRPDKVKVGDNVPILVWIHGGAFKSGAAARWDMSTITAQSAEMSRPMIVVSMNYRMNTFGFLQTDELPVEDLSAGLLDQRLAMKWVYENAAAFGGDNSKTIFGESAGAVSVALHVTYAPASSRYFRAAICDSGSPTGHTVPPVSLYDQPGLPYARLKDASNCTSLECLRKLPYESLLAATAIAMVNVAYSHQLSTWGPSVKKGSYISERPSVRVKEGHFNYVPIIMGTNLDEGTLFALSAAQAAQVDTNNPGQASDQYLFQFMTNTSILDVSAVNQSVYNRVAELYPNNPVLGAPFGTADESFGLSAIFKRMAAWNGDLHYHAPRRLFSQHAAPLQPTYVYEFTGPYNSSDQAALGVYHYSELALVFGYGRVDMLNSREATATLELAKRWRAHYINFVHDMNPGGDWPIYTGVGGQVKQFNKYNSTNMLDNWRVEQLAYLNSQPALDTYYT